MRLLKRAPKLCWRPERFFYFLALALIQVISICFLQVIDANQKLYEIGEEDALQKDAALEFELAAAESSLAAPTATSPTSHEILASGWPLTSPMWPSIETEGNSMRRPSGNQTNEWRPFIYSDEPSKQDYSLLLSLNASLIEVLLSSNFSQGQQLEADLSFEFYFNFGAQVTALPGIKIEVDRKELDYLEPTTSNRTTQPGGVAPRPIKSKMWISYSRRLVLNDAAAQLGKPDWLKLSLVNREMPSMVALRLIMVTFGAGSNPLGAGGAADPQARPISPVSPGDTGLGEQAAVQPSPAPVPLVPQTPPIQSVERPPPLPPGPETLSPAYNAPDAQTPGGFSPSRQSPPLPPSEPLPDPNAAAPDPNEDERLQASNPLTSTIKPVASKKRAGWTGAILGRKRRQALDGSGASNSSGPRQNEVIELTCFSSLACDHWRSSDQAVAAGQFRWSLARMPPSIDPVQNGYYYASNRLSHGRPLLLRLNQTETATITDQKTDHCLELALYVTEGSRLRLYKMLKGTSRNASSESPLEAKPSLDDDDDEWLKSSPLLTWAPTTTTSTTTAAGVVNPRERPHLNGAQMTSSKQSGWILETLCFGDFFEVDSKCGLGECAFAFEMSSSEQTPNELSNGFNPAASARASEFSALSSDQKVASGSSATSGQSEANEQVVGVALLRKFAAAAPNKHTIANRWLEYWQRPEVEPDDNWNFYPKMDYTLGADNVSLLNLYHEAHYSIHSDWIRMGNHLNLEATLAIELLYDEAIDQNGSQTAVQNGTNRVEQVNSVAQGHTGEQLDVEFRLNIEQRLVNQHFETIYTVNSSIDWLKHYNNNETHLAISRMPLANASELIFEADRQNVTPRSELTSMFKVIIELDLDCHKLRHGNAMKDETNTGQHRIEPQFRLSLANVSLADRCFPNPCEWGTCSQNGTGPEDWDCKCDKEHRGRRCQFGSWCSLAHVAPPTLSTNLQQQSTAPAGAASAAPSEQQQLAEKRQSDGSQQLQIILKPSTEQQKQQNGAISKAGALVPPLPPPPPGKISPEAGSSNVRLSGDEFCKRKLGPGFKCHEIDLPLDDKLHLDEGETFVCSCRGDYYLSDEGKCKQAHRCHSIVCEHVGEICDDTKPFNETKPCHCNEKLDWFPQQPEPGQRQHSATGTGGCVRRQCHDKKRDCGFEAHFCLPGPAGERPTCKCGPKFTLKTDDRGKKWCQSSACVLPTLNDCDHICTPNDTDVKRPFTCSCHAGFTLDKDGKSCRPNSHVQQHQSNLRKPSGQPICKPACDQKTQICTELGCRCRQGYLAEGEVVVQVHTGQQQAPVKDYVQSIRCLNVCSLSYAENKAEFGRIESVCPFGLCDPDTFNCRCSDPNSSALLQSKYEPIWAPQPLNQTEIEPKNIVEVGEEGISRVRISPLCRLKRVCQPESAAFQLCKARGSICVPDYTKPAMYDCICPSSSERRPLLSGASSELDFQCGPRCSSIKQECLKKQAICRQMGKDQVRCECAPGMMLDKHDDKCYLAHYTYKLQLIVVNKYYEPPLFVNETLNSSNEVASKGNGTENTAMVASVDGTRDQFLQELVPQFQRSAQIVAGSSNGDANRLTKLTAPTVYASHREQQCNTSQLLPKSILEDPYEQDMSYFRHYAEQCAEKLLEDSRTFSLNSQLAEDIRKSVRQHLHRPFTITTNNSLCHEVTLAPLDEIAGQTAPYLNCTVFVQSMEPIEMATMNRIFSDCDKTGSDRRFCWVKPHLLLARQANDNNQQMQTNEMNASTNSIERDSNPFGFKQIVACELEGFCGPEAQSERLDSISSMCSCKCPLDIEMIDLRELEPRLRLLAPHVDLHLTQSDPMAQQQNLQQADPSLRLTGTRRRHSATDTAVKEMCAPRNQCAVLNSSFCLLKPGSRCHYDIRLGSRCQCVWPAYEDELGRCVEVAFSLLDNTLIVIIIMVGTCLIVSLAINLYALARSRRGGLFSRQSRQYPLSEFSSPAANNHRLHHQMNNQEVQRTGRPFNRSTGVPNLAFDPDD